jgi:hypothetical protein
MNHPNIAAVNALYGSGVTRISGFGTVAALAEPRQIRLSIDF